MSNKIKLILADIDECITPFWQNHIDLESMAKLQEYCLKLTNLSNSPQIILNSGRQVPYAEMAVQMLGIFSDYPSILESGCLLYYPKTRKVIINPDITEDTKDALIRMETKIDYLIAEGINKEVGKELCISLNPPLGKNIELFFQNVCNLFANFDKWISITHSKTAVDITPIGMNKGSAVDILEKTSPFKREEMLAIGDSESDLSVMELVGFAACPANACSNVKKLVSKKGGYISPFFETKGVVDIFENLIL